MLSVRKLAYLPSVQENNPQKYILWQTISILGFKTLFIPIVVITYFALKTHNVVFLLILADTIIIPLTVELSYLGCNKRNVETLVKEFKLKKVLKVIFGKENEIAPVAQQRF